MPGLVGVVSVLGMAVVAPLGLRLLATPGVRRLVAPWPFLALLAAAGLLLPRGGLAVALVTPYALACAAVALLAARRGLAWLPDRRTPLTREMVAATAGGSLLVVALSIVPERAGAEFLGYSLPILGLAVAHFHFAGFAAVLIAGLTAEAAPGPVAYGAAWCVPVGTAITLVGFFTTNAVELAGAAVLTAGLLATSYVLLRRVVPRLGKAPRALLTVTALAAPLTMALAMWWAVGEAAGIAHPSLRQMAATHGVGNALGVGLCGLLGWTRARPPLV